MSEYMPNALREPDGDWSAYAPIVAGAVRTVLAAMGGLGMGWALTVSASQIEMAVSTAMMAAAAIWSAYQKIDAARKAHRASADSAIASANATMAQGQPVAVVVAPGANPGRVL